MPQIPTFDVSVPVPSAPAGPHADPGAFAQAGAGLGQGAAEFGAVADQWAQRYREARQASDAAGLVAEGTRQFDDLSAQLSKLPDAASAEAQFRAGSDDIRKSLLAQTSDPLVQSHVDSQLQLHAAMRQEVTRAKAFGVESSQKVADLQGTRLPGYANTLASAADPQLRAATLDQMSQDLLGMSHAGWVSPEASLALQSGTVKSAIEMRAASDPIGAQALLNTLRDRLTAPDQARLEESLRTQVPRRQAENIAMAISNGGSGPATPENLDNNIGNIRATSVAWDGKGQPMNGFETFGSPELGARAALQNIKTQERKNGGSLTIGSLIKAWAPPTENDTQAYVADVSGRTGIAPDQALNTNDPAQMQSLLKAMNIHEKGKQTAPDDALSAGIGSVLNNTPLDGQQSDIATKLQQVRAATKDLPPQWQDHAEFMLLRRYHDEQSAQAGARGELGRSVANLEQSYLQGITSEDIPEDDIRSLYPPDKAQDIIDKLSISRQAGDLFSSVQYASPDQQRQALQTLATPGSVGANRILVRNHQVVPPANGDAPADETPDQAKLRQSILTQYQALLKRKQDALQQDPAGYAATQPDMAALLKSVDPNDPASRSAALNRLLDVQAQLGVADADRRVMTNGQVQQTVSDLTQGDPAQVNVASRLDALRDQYGDLWPRAFKDLVRVGKLNPQWQVVAAMTEPGQAGARSDLVRVLQTMAQPGGAQKITENVPPDAKRVIDKNLAEDLAPFRATISLPGQPDNADVYNGVQEAVRNLAYTRAYQGKDGEAAVKSAVDDVLGNKYDFEPSTSSPFHTMRTPKGLMPQAQQFAQSIQNKLQPDDLAPPAMGDPSLTPQQNAHIVADAASRNGIWATNEHDDGAVLLAPLRNGAYTPVVLKGGSRVEFKWPEARNAPVNTSDDGSNPSLGPTPIVRWLTGGAGKAAATPPALQ